MPKHENIRKHGFRNHYEAWVASHPGAVPYDKLVHYIEYGDEFGDHVPVRKLAKAAKTTVVTMLKWLPIIKEEITANKP